MPPSPAPEILREVVARAAFAGRDQSPMGDAMPSEETQTG